MYDESMKDTVSECEYAIFLSYYLCISLKYARGVEG